MGNAKLKTSAASIRFCASGAGQAINAFTSASHSRWQKLSSDFMTIKTRLTKTDFINVNFVLLFAKVFIRVIFLIMILSLLFGVVSAIIPNSFAGDFSASRILTPIFVLAFLPAVTYFVSIRNYSSDKRISESIEYKFEKDYLIIQGESFNSQLTWDKIYKVTQTKNWLLIWQTKQSANAIHKTDVWDGQIDELKKILIEHRVKINFSQITKLSFCPTLQIVY